MSTLATGSYSMQAVRMAQRNRDYRIGFIGQNRITTLDDGSTVDDDFIYMTPGVVLVAR